MKQYRMNVTLTLPALAGAVMALAGCGHQRDLPPPEQLPTARVRAATVEERSRTATEEVVGTVRARLRASLEAKISGRIEQIPVVAGQSVRAGELLVQLDAREIAARRDQAKATHEQAERDLQRFAALRKDASVTQQEYDAMEARHRVAEAGLAEAETMLGYTRITAPFDGLVTRKTADVGDLASPGRSLLDLEDPKGLRIEADVPEAFLGRIELGQTMPVRVLSATNVVSGTVSEISPLVDPASRTFRVKLDLPAASGLRPGQFGRVAVPAGESAALRVPVSAVVNRGQMEFVYVLSEGKAHLRIVKTGKRLGNEVEVVSGLAAGEQIVAEDAPRLRDGQPVEVTP